MKLFDIRDRIAAAPPPPPPVRVNGVEIPAAEIVREIQHHPAPSAAAARAAAARALAVRELMLQEARRLGLVPQPGSDADGRRETDEDALVRQLLETALAVPSPSEDECRQFYAAHLDRFRAPDLYEIEHILFAARPDDREAYAEARRRAVAVIAKLKAHPESFAEMAAALSSCPSAEAGGNLGQITADRTTPEFAAALATMEPGRLCPVPVETRYGVHVVRMGRRIDGAVLPFELVKGRIARYLADRVFHHAVRQYIAILAGRASIEGVDLAGTGRLPVQ